MPWNLLLPPLLAGFLFLRHTHRFKFRHQRLNGYRLLFDSSLCGLLLLTAARVITWSAARWTPIDGFRAWWAEIAPFPYSGAAAASLLLGVTLPLVWNRLASESGAKRRAVAETDDRILQFLGEAATRNRPILITLDNRKTYAGFVLDAPNLSRDGAQLGLLPLRSGYRTSEELRLELELDYAPLYREPGVNPNQFRIVAPLDRVTTFQYFDLRVFDRSSKGEQPPD